jgi:hypothetical protein
MVYNLISSLPSPRPSQYQYTSGPLMRPSLLPREREKRAACVVAVCDAGLLAGLGLGLGR